MRLPCHLLIVGFACSLIGCALLTTVVDHTRGARLLQDADAARQQGQFAQSEDLYNQAVNYIGTQYGRQSIRFADALDARSDVYMDEHRFREAENDLVQSRVLKQQLLGLDNIELARNLRRLGVVYTERGNFSEAEACLLRAQAIAEKQPAVSPGTQKDPFGYLTERFAGPREQVLPAVLSDLGWMYSKQGQYEKSESAYQRALFIRQTTLGQNDRAVAKTLQELALLYSLERRFDKANEANNRALTIINKTSVL